MVLPFAETVHKFRGIALDRANYIADIVCNFIADFIHVVASVPEVRYLDIHARVQQYILSFYIAMRDPPVVEVSQGRDELSENVSGRLLGKAVGLADDAEEFSALLYFHDVVEDAPDFSVESAADPAHVEVDDLNYVAMLPLKAHLHFVQEHVQNLGLVPPLDLRFVYFLVHDLDGHPFVRGEVDAHFDSKLREEEYLEKRPRPSLKSTLYF